MVWSKLWLYKLRAHATSQSSRAALELLLLVEEHGKAYDRPVDQQAADNAHDHGLYPDEIAMREDGR